ncbi:avidin-related protein 4/5-like [Apostichopus japonicus]|uniref:avidin-related protein 4/5-like n=1 Tax=Stichopus japonicus TaxID=307972 RepID=UPI003AB61A61
MGVLAYLYCLFVLCEQSIDPSSSPTAVVNPVTQELNTGCNLKGFWYNQRGSEVYLKVSSEGYIKGEYRTAVEFAYGAAGNGPSYITGWSNMEGTVFGFTVLWEGFNTTSTTSWTGVCVHCDGVDTLTTAWVLHRSVPRQCTDDITVYSGSDTFTRVQQAQGPRSSDNTHNPRDFKERLRLLERNGANDTDETTTY